MAAAFIASCSGDKSANPSKDLDQPAAIDAVRHAILPMVLHQGDRYACIRMDGSLPAGTTIEEDAPAIPGVMGAARVSMTLGEESYLFYLDLSPGAFYGHEVKYIIIGKSNRYQILNAEWWLKINGQPYDRFMKVVPDSQYVVAGNVELSPPGGSVARFPLYDRGVPSSEAFIVVQGLMPGEALHDEAETTYHEMLNFFLAYASPTAKVDSLAEADARSIFSTIDLMASANKRVITVAIIANGNTDYVRLGGDVFTADNLVAEINLHPDAAFNVLLCSCHGGSFLDNLKPLPNVLVAHAASKGNESVFADCDVSGALTDENPEDAGAEWVSSVLAAANAIAHDPAKWNEIVAAAASRGVPATSMLIQQACLGAIGANPAFGLSANLDLASRLGWETPQGYARWELTGR